MRRVRRRQVLGRHRRAERGDGVLDAELNQARDVEIALDDDDLLRPARVLPRLVEPVQLVAFAKDRRLRRVQVFRLAGVEHAAAEADDLAARRVADREHDAIAKSVVAPARVVRDDEARPA